MRDIKKEIVYVLFKRGPLDDSQIAVGKLILNDEERFQALEELQREGTIKKSYEKSSGATIYSINYLGK